MHNPVKTAFEMIPQAERFLLLFFVFKIQVSVAEKIFVAAFAKIVCAVK